MFAERKHSRKNTIFARKIKSRKGHKISYFVVILLLKTKQQRCRILANKKLFLNADFARNKLFVK